MLAAPVNSKEPPTQWVRDARGRIVERITRAPDGRLIRSDPVTGKRLGTVEPGIGDRLILKDAHGRRTGTLTKGIGQRRILSDPGGKRIGTIETGIGNRRVIKDGSGRKVGSVTP